MRILPVTTRVVAFDFNGVIVDDEPFHFEALRRTFEPFGYSLTRDAYWERYLAFDDEEAVRRLAEESRANGARIPEGVAHAALVRTKIDHYMRMVGRKPPLFADAVPVVRRLARQFPMVIVSGARREEIELTLAAAGIERCFETIVAAEDTPESKPSPLPYLKALELMKCSADGMTAIEDSVGGLRSARAAGLRTIAVTHSYPREKLETEAHLVIGRIGDLLTEGGD